MEAPRQPAVTADSLGGTDLAQNALAAAAGDGKNYPYVYPRGDIETAVEDTRQALENAIKGTLMSADHYREQGDTEQAERLEQQARQSREELEIHLADARRQLEREAEDVYKRQDPARGKNVQHGFRHQPGVLRRAQ